jgi:hypothetical protein
MIASVLQQLTANAQKTADSSAIKSNWFQQTILAPGNFGRYNDDVIQASILPFQTRPPFSRRPRLSKFAPLSQVNIWLRNHAALGEWVVVRAENNTTGRTVDGIAGSLP